MSSHILYAQIPLMIFMTCSYFDFFPLHINNSWSNSHKTWVQFCTHTPNFWVWFIVLILQTFEYDLLYSHSKHLSMIYCTHTPNIWVWFIVFILQTFEYDLLYSYFKLLSMIYCTHTRNFWVWFSVLILFKLLSMI